MKTPKRSKRAGVSAEEHEERAVSILSSLLRNLTPAAGASKQRERILSKFVENDHEKVDRLMEIHDKYLGKVQAADQDIDEEVNVVQCVVLQTGSFWPVS